MSSQQVAHYWDGQAQHFDDQPDHGLHAAVTRTAWADLLGRLLRPPPGRVADLGCGTGSLSVLLAAQGHHVTGLDLSPAMLGQARAKATHAAVDIDFRLGDAATPDLETGWYDVVLARHVVWALPEPARSLAAWAGLLAPGGRLVLIEGHWSTGAGLRSAELAALVRGTPQLAEPVVEGLPDPVYWGGPIDDERYVVTADLLCDKGARSA
jgi:SAM-dependent methyltransferase